MYKLYTIPGSCSTGIHILLNVLNQPFEVITKDSVEHFDAISPTGAVPVLDDNGTLLREGGAIALYLLEKHKSDMLPQDLLEKGAFLQKMMFNYSTMHPAYNRLFFAMANYTGAMQEEAYAVAAKAISRLWKVVDTQLASSRFVSGEHVTINDYMLCIYANWGTFFKVDISLGANVERMIKEVSQLPEFQSAFKAEGLEYGLLSD